MKVRVIGQNSRSPSQKYEFCIVYLTYDLEVKGLEVKVKCHVAQGQRSHGSRSKVIGQGQMRVLIAFVSYISPSETGRWAHINVKLLCL